MRSVTIKNETSGGKFSVFDAETGEQLRNVYRVELLFERSVNQARITFSDNLTRGHQNTTHVEVFTVVSANCTFGGFVAEDLRFLDWTPDYIKRTEPSLEILGRGSIPATESIWMRELVRTPDDDNDSFALHPDEEEARRNAVSVTRTFLSNEWRDFRGTP